jgi:hypothetical protein
MISESRSLFSTGRTNIHQHHILMSGVAEKSFRFKASYMNIHNITSSTYSERMDNKFKQPIDI